MSRKPLQIDMIAGSQLRDTQGELLNLEGADISELLAGRGRLNDNHGKGSWNCIGRVIGAKKIFKAEDCEDDRQRYYWDKVKSPYLYLRGELFDDEDHPNARAAAAILRHIHKANCPLKLKASVEGGVIARGISDPTLLARTKIHSCALTFVPANQATLVEPLGLEKSTFSEQEDYILIKSVMHLAQTSVPSFRHITRDASAARVEENINTILKAIGDDTASVDLKRALVEESLELKISENIHRIYTLAKGLTAGYGGAGSPMSLTGGGVMQSESLDIGPKKLSYITCDNCGKEQVYGKYQVKCRECSHAFPMAKLENFFRINKG